MIFLIFKYFFSFSVINIIGIKSIEVLKSKINKFIIVLALYIVYLLLNLFFIYDLYINYIEYRDFRKLNIEKITSIKIDNQIVSNECMSLIFQTLKQEDFILPSFPHTSKKYYITINSKDDKFYFRINQVKDLGTLITLKRGSQDVTTYRNNQLSWAINSCKLEE